MRFLEQTYVKYYRQQAQKGNYACQSFLVGDAQEVIASVWGRKHGVFTEFIITINPPPEEQQVWDKLIKLFNRVKGYKNFLAELQMVLEQRSEDIDMPYGYHCHIAAKNAYGQAASQVIQRVYNAYKYVFRDSPGTQVIDVRPSTTAYQYVNGEKKDSTKEEKMEVDKRLRSQNNYLDLY